MNEKAKCKNCTEEMIEEMARVICPNSKEWTCKACNWGSKPNCEAYKNAEKLINEGYRNCKDKVVLAREEHQKYCSYKIIEPQIRGCLDRERELERKLKGLKEENHTLRLENNDLEAQVEQARKETAKEILQTIYDGLTKYYTTDHIKEIAKQFGVEVEE